MDQPTLWALRRSFTRCKFIESVGDVVFFKDMRGEVARECAIVVDVDGVGSGKDGEAGGETERAEAGHDEKEDVMVD